MTTAESEFAAHVRTILARFVAQNEQPPVAADALEVVAERLWVVVNERGLPRPLAPHERGEPGGMDEAECAALVRRVTGPSTPPIVAEGVRQLIKACFHPEFKTCRDSFRELAPDGSCRRQELARVVRRVSGTHCVDCPYWVTLDAPRHVAFLHRYWRAGAAAFDAHREVYLPEDFRAFKQWLHAAARARD